MDKPTLKPRGEKGSLKSRLGSSAEVKVEKPSALKVLKAALKNYLDKSKSTQAKQDPKDSRTEPGMSEEVTGETVTAQVEPIQEEKANSSHEKQNTDGLREPRKPKRVEKPMESMSSSDSKKSFFSLSKRIKQKTNTKRVLEGKHNPAYILVQEVMKVLGPSQIVSPKTPKLIVASVEGREVYWDISSKGVELIQDVPKNATAISFTNLDIRVFAAKQLSKSAAKIEVSRELGIKPHVVNKSGELYAVYGTPAERSEALSDSLRLVPGAAVLDRLIRRKADSIELGEDQSLIFGVQFPQKANPSQVGLIVLSAKEPSGEISAPQVSVNPDSIDFLINQFAAARRIPRAKTKVMLFSFQDYLDIEDDLPKYAYPAEPDFNGIKLKQVMAAGLIGSAAVTGYSLLNLSFYTLNAKTESAKAEQMKKQLAQVEQELKEFTKMKARPIASILNEPLSLNLILDNAEKIYVQDSSTTANALGSTVRYTMKVPVIKKGGSIIPLEVLGAQKMQEVLAYEPPKECVREKVTFNGNLNDIIVEVTCTGPDSLVHSFRSK